MKNFSKLSLISFFIIINSCNHKSKSTDIKSFDSIAYGWKMNDIPSVVWLNNEPICWINRGGYLHDWNTFPLKKGANSLKINISGNDKVDVSDFSLRTIIAGKTEEVMSDNNLENIEYNFILNSVSSINNEIAPIKNHTFSTELLKNWVLNYLENIEKKDAKALAEMITYKDDISRVCPWVLPELELDFRANKLSELEISQGDYFTLIYPNIKSHDLSALCVSKNGTLTYRLNYFLFVQSKNEIFYFNSNESKSFLPIKIIPPTSQ